MEQPPKSVHVDEAQCLALMSVFLFNHAIAKPNISRGIAITGDTPPPVMRDEPIPPPARWLSLDTRLLELAERCACLGSRSLGEAKDRLRLCRARLA